MDVSLGQVKLIRFFVTMTWFSRSQFDLMCQIKAKKSVFAGSHEPLIGFLPNLHEYMLVTG